MYTHFELADHVASLCLKITCHLICHEEGRRNSWGAAPERIACSRLQDSGKSRSRKVAQKMNGGWGDTE